MSRTRVRRRRVAATVAAVAVVAALQGSAGEAGAAGTAQIRPGEARAYVVRPGDTVWRIAEQISEPGTDLRPLVDAIVEANGVDPGALMAGRTLAIPSD